jgi:hypothetical protein
METPASAGQHEPPRSNRKLRIFLWLLILAAATEFVLRGPARFLQPIDWNDLAQNYAASKLWLRGQNPSSAESFVALWLQEVHVRIDPTVRTHLAPPLGSLVLMAPIAVFPWPVAKVVWAVLLLAAFGLTVLALARTADFPFEEPRTLAFVAACLALAPYHTGLGTGNVTILVVAACALAIWAAGRGHDIAAGALFAVACSFKPHIGAFLVLYYLLRRRWKLFGSSLAFTAAFALLAVLWMQLRGVAWTHDYFQNAKGFVGANRIDDFSSANPIRFMLINLQVPFYSFSGSSSSANLLAFSIGALLVCAWIYLVLRDRESGSELLALAAIAVISLLPIYHRLYDATLLVFPLCWCLSRAADSLRTISRVALFLMAPFLVPGAAVLQQLSNDGHIPAVITQSWWWTHAIMPHETWFLLALSLVLLYGLALQRRDQGIAA